MGFIYDIKSKFSFPCNVVATLAQVLEFVGDRSSKPLSIAGVVSSILLVAKLC